MVRCTLKLVIVKDLWTPKLLGINQNSGTSTRAQPATRPSSSIQPIYTLYIMATRKTLNRWLD